MGVEQPGGAAVYLAHVIEVWDAALHYPTAVNRSIRRAIEEAREYLVFTSVQEGGGMIVTIRETTKEERKQSWPQGDKGRMFEKYVLVNTDIPENYCLSFGILPVTANTKGEMLYWARRYASKNGATLVLPPGWDKVKIPKEWRSDGY